MKQEKKKVSGEMLLTYKFLSWALLSSPIHASEPSSDIVPLCYYT